MFLVAADDDVASAVRRCIIIIIAAVAHGKNENVQRNSAKILLSQPFAIVAPSRLTTARATALSPENFTNLLTKPTPLDGN